MNDERYAFVHLIITAIISVICTMVFFAGVVAAGYASVQQKDKPLTCTYQDKTYVMVPVDQKYKEITVDEVNIASKKK